MPSTTFVARRPGPFSALVQAAEIGGYRMEPLAPVRVHDRYFDTETGDLMRRGWALRMRDQGGARAVGLRAIRDDEAATPPDVDLLGPADERRLYLPPSLLATAVSEMVGSDALEPLLSLRQYRTPRVVHEGSETVGVLSFDVVIYEVLGARVVSNEVEVRDERDLLERLAPVLGEHGLEPAPRSKFARAVLRHPRTLAQPVLLLPDEVQALEDAVAAGDVQRRRRASVVLLDARGFRPDTIAAQTGMSMARVRHWRQRFREVRMGVLDAEPSVALSRRPAARAAAARPLESAEGASTPDRRSARPAPEPASPDPTPPDTPKEELTVQEPASLKSTVQVPPHSEPSAPLAASEGDGMLYPGHLDGTQVADMAELLEMFSPSIPDTPLLSGTPSLDDLEDEDDGQPEPADVPAAPAVLLAPRNPYPVVLGPIPVRPAAAAAAPLAASAGEEVVAPGVNGDVVVDAATVQVEAWAPFAAGNASAARTPAIPEAAPSEAAVTGEAAKPEPAASRPASSASAARPAPQPEAPVSGGGPSRPAEPPAGPNDPFAEVDFRALRRDRSPSRAETPAAAHYRSVEDVPAGDGLPGAPVVAPSVGAPSASPTPRRPPAPAPRPTHLTGDMPLVEAARAALADHLGQFEAQAEAFLASRAPSDARRLLIAAQRLRLTIETFGRTLPPHTTHRLVSALRPLVDDLDASLNYARGAALAPGRTDLARLSAASITSAVARLGSSRQRAWGERSRRLLAHLDRQRAQGLRPDDVAAPPPDDFVGEPGDVPTPTRLRHILGTTLWARFEAIRAFQDDLSELTPDLAAHLAVALSALRFVLGLVEGIGEGYVADVAAALDAAEREVPRPRHRAMGAALGVVPGTVSAELAVVAQVWAEVTAPPFRKRLATVVATV